mmetsp:Transcript_10887/g.16587  ORF Transcript_10887/g.16587 Transcript_10887/m.16587 type:complete len:236 (-) Transcript_10887:1492-2199(-)
MDGSGYRPVPLPFLSGLSSGDSQSATLSAIVPASTSTSSVLLSDCFVRERLLLGDLERVGEVHIGDLVIDLERRETKLLRDFPDSTSTSFPISASSVSVLTDRAPLIIGLILLLFVLLSSVEKLSPSTVSSTPARLNVVTLELDREAVDILRKAVRELKRDREFFAFSSASFSSCSIFVFASSSSPLIPKAVSSKLLMTSSFFATSPTSSITLFSESSTRSCSAWECIVTSETCF